MRIYRDRDGSFILVLLDNEQPGGAWDAIANVYAGPRPSLVGTSLSPMYVAQHWLRRMQWSELPPEWQEAFIRYMKPTWDGEPDFQPESIRGLWRVGNQPETPECPKS